MEGGGGRGRSLVWYGDGDGDGAGDTGGLWARLRRRLRPPEVDPLRRLIGEDVIDANEILIAELQSLGEILCDMEDEGVVAPPPRSLLPGPRSCDLLRAKVTALLESVTKDGGPPPLDTPREAEIARLLTDHTHGRPSSAAFSQSSSSTETPRRLRTPTAPLARLLASAQSLTPLDVDPLVHDLRSALEEERLALEAACEDARQRLHSRLDPSRAVSSAPVDPTVAELTALAAKLEVEEEARDHRTKIRELPDTRDPHRLRPLGTDRPATTAAASGKTSSEDGRKRRDFPAAASRAFPAPPSLGPPRPHPGRRRSVTGSSDRKSSLTPQSSEAPTKRPRAPSLGPLPIGPLAAARHLSSR